MNKRFSIDLNIGEIMAGKTWGLSVLVAVVVLFAVSEFRTVEAQSPLVNECRTGGYQCDVNAYCYDTVASYRCICRRGWYGDGYVGQGYNGCRRRTLGTWQRVTSIVGSIVGFLLILCCLLTCIRRRRMMSQQQQGAPAYGYPQQAYPPQQGVPMYATQNNHNNDKVPGPAGVV